MPINAKNWLFSGSLAAGARAADIMSLIQTAKMNGIEPLAYLTDVLMRLPTHPNSRIDELLPTRWRPADTDRRVGQALALTRLVVLPSAK